MSEEKGVKYDDGKIDYTLLPWDSLDEVVGVLQGAINTGKYPRDNWQKVPDGRQRYVKGAFRHLRKAMFEPSIDPDFGRMHLAHAACCLLFAIWFDLQWKEKQPKEDPTYLNPDAHDYIGCLMKKLIFDQLGKRNSLERLQNFIVTASNPGEEIVIQEITLTEQGKKRFIAMLWSEITRLLKEKK